MLAVQLDTSTSSRLARLAWELRVLGQGELRLQDRIRSMAARLANVVVLVAMVVVSSGVFAGGQNTSFSFPSFPTSNYNIDTDGDIQFDQQNSSYIMNTLGTLQTGSSCGKIVYKDPVVMKDHTGAVASFHTAFTSSFELPQKASSTLCADGMVFTFTESTNVTTLEYERNGVGFCRLNFTASSSDQHTFAVELDSFMNPAIDGGQDPTNTLTGSHIGVDVNNNSLGTADICANVSLMPSFCSGSSPQGFCGPAKTFVAWIDYDSPQRKLEVRIREGNSYDDSYKPAAAAITVNDLALGQVLEDKMYVGFSASTGLYQDTHRLSSWRFETTGLTAPPPAPSPTPPAPAPPPTSPAPPRMSKGLVVGISVGAIVCALATFLGIFWICKRRRRTTASQELQQYVGLGELGLTDASWAFTYKEISRITKNFSDSELLASGGFGDVFKGTLASGEVVAVKRIKGRKEHDVKNFLAEANSMRQIRHRNLLQLRGWCVCREGLMLVLDYMPNSSLDKWLHGKSGLGLPWDLRRNILAGVASGLAYLHGDGVRCVLHRDIKSSNVMLDADFNAVLGDFGLTRLVDHHKLDKPTLMAGTLGYMGPEMHYTGRATKETDVFAFGILVLEVLSGRRPLDSNHPKDYILLDFAWRAHEAGDPLRVADRRLFDNDGDVDKSRGIDETRGIDAEGTGLDTATVVVDGTTGLETAIMTPDETAELETAIMTPDETAELETARGSDETLMKSMLHLGLLCCHPNPSERPSMRDVNQWLFKQSSEGGTLELPLLPATRPHIAHYPTMFTQFSESGVSDVGSSSQTSSLIRHSYSALLESATGAPVSARESVMPTSAVSMEFGFPR